MSTLNQLREGLTRAWESVTEGWREMIERAGDALTRFRPRHSGKEVEVDVEVPGMDPGDFDISVYEDMLVVRGEKKVRRERTEGQFRVMERAYGAFERAVRLPVPVEESGARASYRRGVLHIALPRSAAHRVRRIEVTRV